MQDLHISIFHDVTSEEHAGFVEKAVGVKAHTGPVIALAYNLMRIVEGVVPYSDVKTHAIIEEMLDFLGNTVFSQKHGVESLHDRCVEAVCLADAIKMEQMGFDREGSRILCNIIMEKATEIGVLPSDLPRHFKRHTEEGRSNIINTLVRRFHKVYFATRACLHPIRLIEHLETEQSDLVGHLFRRSVSISYGNRSMQRLENLFKGMGASSFSVKYMS